VWQAIVVEFLLAVSDQPKLLLQYDLVGNRLTEDVDLHRADCIPDRVMYGQVGANRSAEEILKGESSGWSPERVRELYITHVGAEAGWKEAVPAAHPKPVPFDEPTLGILGMWRLGGGANPHFALALGEIMLRVGQRYIAWCAYERAAGMADRVWPNADIQRQFAEHCRRRQKTIEQQLPAEEVEQLRPRFEAELAYGQHYQKDYQDYEAARIREGASLDDDHFYDDFHATHPPIASPVGEEEKFVAELGTPQLYLNWPVAVLAAGVSACLAAWLVRCVGFSRGYPPP
jgi:hypothetical protein